MSSPAVPCLAADPTASSSVLPAHVVVVTNFIAAHRTPLYRELARRVARLTILLSTPMEANRRWQPDWEGLDVVLQRTTTVPQLLRHRVGFDDRTYVHIPWDTVPRLRGLRPDVILSAELGARSLLAATYTSLMRRVPLVLWAGLSEHTEQNKGHLRHFVRRRLLPRADAVVVNGRSGARYLESLGVPPRRIFRLCYTCLPGVFDRGPATRTSEQTYKIVTAGQLIERKGIVPFLQALARWARRHPERVVEFTVAGSGPLDESLRTFATPPNLRVQLAGHCNYDRLAELYQQSGIFAFPSLSDDWGISVNEALTAGLPVLGCVYAQSVDELCIEGVTGWRFRTDMPVEIDSAVSAALATCHERLNAMRMESRQRVQHLTPGFAADQLVRALWAACESRRRRYKSAVDARQAAGPPLRSSQNGRATS